MFLYMPSANIYLYFLNNVSIENNIIDVMNPITKKEKNLIANSPVISIYSYLIYFLLGAQLYYIADFLQEWVLVSEECSWQFQTMCKVQFIYYAKWNHSTIAASLLWTCSTINCNIIVEKIKYPPLQYYHYFCNIYP